MVCNYVLSLCFHSPVVTKTMPIIYIVLLISDFFFVCLPIYDRNDSNVTIDGILFTNQQNELHFTAKWKKIGLVSTFNSPLAKRQSIDCFFIVTKWQNMVAFNNNETLHFTRDGWWYVTQCICLFFFVKKKHFYSASCFCHFFISNWFLYLSIDSSDYIDIRKLSNRCICLLPFCKLELISALKNLF